MKMDLDNENDNDIISDTSSSTVSVNGYKTLQQLFYNQHILLYYFKVLPQPATQHEALQNISWLPVSNDKSGTPRNHEPNKQDATLQNVVSSCPLNLSLLLQLISFLSAL